MRSRANLRHVLLCTQRVARVMVEHRISGSIITVTSIEGVRAAPGYAAYAAAKAGVVNYTKSAALELAAHGIRVNALAPDFTLTEGLRAMSSPIPGARRPHGANGARRRRRRNGRRSNIFGIGHVVLRDGPDHPRRWRHRGRRRLVPPTQRPVSTRWDPPDAGSPKRWQTIVSRCHFLGSDGAIWATLRCGMDSPSGFACSLHE